MGQTFYVTESRWTDELLKKNTDWTLEDTNNDKLTKLKYMYNVIKFKTI